MIASRALPFRRQPFPGSSSRCSRLGPWEDPRRFLHASSAKAANPLPIVATGPPPAPPRPSVTESRERVDRRRRHAELVQENPALRGTDPPRKPRDALKRRFWKHVNVQRTPEGLHSIHLDARPVRSPHSKTPLLLPASKPHLATAIALEWDTLASAQQALKSHLIPLTSLAARAHDVAIQDAADAEAGVALGAGPGGSRRDIVQQVLKYLDTDTLLCWTPRADSESEAHRAAKAAAALVGPAAHAASLAPSGMDRGRGAPPAKPSLREQQERVAQPIAAFLTTYVWPGVELRPALAEDSILPAAQPEMTRQVVRGWLMGLGAWELAGLERATLASKSLCIAARLVCEWSENFPRIKDPPPAAAPGMVPRFGIDEAELACTVEVRWQIGQWGEVEDAHDVDREDLRRQLGAAVLLVSGTREDS